MDRFGCLHRLSDDGAHVLIGMSLQGVEDGDGNLPGLMIDGTTRSSAMHGHELVVDGVSKEFLLVASNQKIEVSNHTHSATEADDNCSWVTMVDGMTSPSSARETSLMMPSHYL